MAPRTCAKVSSVVDVGGSLARLPSRTNIAPKIQIGILKVIAHVFEHVREGELGRRGDEQGHPIGKVVATRIINELILELRSEPRTLKSEGVVSVGERKFVVVPFEQAIGASK